MSLPNVGAALYTRLTEAAPVAALVSARVYEAYIPGKVARPRLVYYLASGRTPHTTARGDIDDVWRVEAQADTRAGAEALWKAVQDALNNQALPFAGWATYWCRSEGTARITDLIEGGALWRYITDFRIRVSEE